jgi:hypothetical protein
MGIGPGPKGKDLKMFYKISQHRKDKRLLILSAFNPAIEGPVLGYDPDFKKQHAPKIWDIIGGHGFDGFCQKEADGSIHFASFQLESVERNLVAAGWESAA